MAKAALEDKGDVAILRMTNGITNGINPEMLENIKAQLARVKEDYRGMVLAGNSRFFSNGLDLPLLLELNRRDMTDFYHDFNETVLAIYTLPMPTACALTGHAIGGGNILALAGDYRFMAEGRKYLGLIEVKLGVPVPFLADLMLRPLARDRVAKDLLYTGEMMTSKRGFETGLVDSTAEEEIVEGEAVKKVSSLAKLSNKAFAAIKACRTERVRSEYLAGFSRKNQEFMDFWFSPDARKLLVEAAEKF